MPKNPFVFSYQLPSWQPHNKWSEVFISGELRSAIPPELRTKHHVADYDKYMTRAMFDGSPFFMFYEKYKEAFEFGAYEGYWFIDTCGYFDGPDKEWERLNTYRYIVLRWKEIHHHGFLSGYEETVNFVKWIFTIEQFLNMFPDNPRIINDYVEYLRMTEEPIKAFKIAIELYEKYQVGDFYINLNYCYWDILELYEGTFIERQEL